MDKAEECVSHYFSKSYIENSPFLQNLVHYIKVYTGIDIDLVQALELFNKQRKVVVDYILDLPPIPADMIYSVYIGIIVAIVGLIVMNFFPGEPMDWEDVDFDEGVSKSAKPAGGSFHIKDEVNENQSNNYSDFNAEKSSISGSDDSESKENNNNDDSNDAAILEYLKDEDKLLKHKGIQKLKTMFSLNDEEIVTAIRDARDEVSNSGNKDVKEAQDGSSSVAGKKGTTKNDKTRKRKLQKKALDDDENGLTLNQRFNIIVYAWATSVLIYYINRDYGDAFNVWFQNTFPKESKFLFPNQ